MQLTRDRNRRELIEKDNIRFFINRQYSDGTS